MEISFGRKILLVDPDESATAPLGEYFVWLGYAARAVKTLREARERLAAEKFDAAICELLLPDGRGVELLDEYTLPILIYSAARRDEDVIGALSRGAADYVFKPCSPRVMAARLECRLPRKNKIFSYHGIELDMSMRSVSYLGRPVKLTSSEFNILRFLMANPGKFFPADVIYEKVWNASSMQTSVVRFHISNLKKTLLAVTGKNLILSEFGAGYAFAAED